MSTVVPTPPRALAPAGALAVGAVALALLAATLAWHVPMMLWDHLDLVPMLAAVERDGLLGAGLFDVHHGSHLHTAAYLVLVGTTGLSGGRPWLDCLVSWVLLLVFAAIVAWMARRGSDDTGRGWPWIAALLALTPAHLPNLQWGWQVAVFLCLAGVAAAIALLTRVKLDWTRNLLALVATTIAIASFTAGLAMVPTAVLLIAMRGGWSWRRRLAFASPWLVAGGAAAVLLADSAQAAGNAPAGAFVLAHYALNFLGGGLTRFATASAPICAALALASVAIWAWRFRASPTARPWLAFCVFATGVAVLVAVGRASAYGVDHAFVTRYASFASLFWLGWCGLAFVALRSRATGTGRGLRVMIGIVLLLSLANALHVAKKAREVGVRAERTAASVQSQWPDVDEAILRDAYFGQAAEAHARLGWLEARGFAPFDRARDPATAR